MCLAGRVSMALEDFNACVGKVFASLHCVKYIHIEFAIAIVYPPNLNRCGSGAERTRISI